MVNLDPVCAASFPMGAALCTCGMSRAGSHLKVQPGVFYQHWRVLAQSKEDNGFVGMGCCSKTIWATYIEMAFFFFFP